MNQPEEVPAKVAVGQFKYVRHMSLMVLLDLIQRKLVTDYGISEPGGKDRRRLVYYVRDGQRYYGFVADTPQNTHMVAKIDYAWESVGLPAVVNQ